MKKLSCVIFDIDGTLAETNELIFASFNYISAKYLGKHFTPQEITAMFGPPEEVVVERLIGTDRFTEAVEDFFEFYSKNFLSMARLHNGMFGVLDFLTARKVLLAVFTGKGSRSTDITLTKLGIRKLFDMIVTGHDVSNHKPSSEGIQRVIDHFRLSPSEVLMIGDAVSDIRAAHEAQIPVAAVVWDSYGIEKVMKMESDYIFHNVEELRDWLEKTVEKN